MSAARRALAALLAAASLGVTLGVAAPADAAHTAHRGRIPTARVDVVDHTGGTWAGVADVVRAWDRSRYVDARLANGCHPRTYCVTVEAGEYGDTGWGAATQPTSVTAATVKLNYSARYDVVLQSAAFCHELGHTFGIAHPAPDASRPGTPGCIASTDPSLTVPLPSWADLAEVRAIVAGGAQGTPQGWGAMYALALVGRR